jgi:acyl-coenzyme A synthetase/AMP-(fatty) acid ligase
VQISPSSPASKEELAKHAAQHLAPYKRPSQIVLVPSMPLTPTGKVIKGELSKINPAKIDLTKNTQTTPSR